MNSKTTHIYIGRLSCGCCVALVNDGGDESTAESVAEFIKDGYTIERVTFEHYKSVIKHEEGFMNCIHKPKQPSLFVL